MYAQWPQPPPPRRSVWLWLGPLLGFAGLLSVVAFVSFVRFCGQAAEAGGVLAGNEVPKTALDRLEKKHILLPGEKLISYYDTTISGDASEIALLTSERLVYVKEGRTTAFALGDIADVRHRTEPLTGDIIEAQTDSGDLMKIEIAPLNDGPTFLGALEAARKSKRTPR
jgi:hypothetical protein